MTAEDDGEGDCGFLFWDIIVWLIFTNLTSCFAFDCKNAVLRMLCSGFEGNWMSKRCLARRLITAPLNRMCQREIMHEQTLSSQGAPESTKQKRKGCTPFISHDDLPETMSSWMEALCDGTNMPKTSSRNQFVTVGMLHPRCATVQDQARYERHAMSYA